MSSQVMQTLILKDWRLHRTHIVMSFAAGVIALALLQVKGETAFLVGSVWFFVSLIVLGSMVPVSNVVNERKKQNLAFLMSLPISALQYAISKMASLAEDDASMNDDKKFADAMGSEKMKKVRDLTASSIESEQTNLFEFNPKMSYPPDEWIKADPFWKPKAAPAAAKKPAAPAQ